MLTGKVGRPSLLPLAERWVPDVPCVASAVRAAIWAELLALAAGERVGLCAGQSVLAVALDEGGKLCRSERAGLAGALGYGEGGGHRRRPFFAAQEMHTSR